MRDLEKRIEELEIKSIELPMSMRDAMRFFAIVMEHSAGQGAPIEVEGMSPEDRDFVEKNMDKFIQFCEMKNAERTNVGH